MTQIEEPTTNEHGDEVHPAFARASVARISHGGGKHGGAVLFDSEVVHQHTVRLRVETATRKRDLNRDWIHGRKQILEIEMSEAQWASLVSSMNSTGTPVTLTWDHGPIPELPYAPRMALQMEEIKGAAKRMFDKAQAAMAAYEQAIEDKAGAKVIKERRRELHFALANSEGNMTFAATSLSEYAEDVVQKARADVEAMVLSKADQLGLDPVHATQGELGTAISALYDKRTETNGYLRGWPRRVTGHDDCCPTAVARMAVLDEQRVALEDQLKRIDSAIVELEKHEVREADGG